jgi:F-type H+-transporting ATPase subunit delta
MTATPSARRAARQLFRLCQVDGRLDDERVRRAAAAVAATGHRDAVGTLRVLRRLVRLERERRTAVVESATALPAPVRAQIRDGLAHLSERAPDAVFRVNHQLIGGVRIRMGSTVYDGSVRGRLDALDRIFAP